MDWPTAAVLCSACIGGGSGITAAVLRFGPSRNGKKIVTEDICSLRHQGLDEDVKELKSSISKIHNRLDEIILQVKKR